jgi:hypothetical protein
VEEREEKMKTYEAPQIFQAGRGSKLIQGQVPPTTSDGIGDLNLPQDVDLTMFGD